MWFQRNDGQLFEAEEGSAVCQMMQKSGEFSPCDADGNEIEANSQQPVLENAGTPGDSGENGAAKRGGTRKPNKAKSS